MTGLARLARVRRSELDWAKLAGPFFGNELGELLLSGGEARFLLWATDAGHEGLRRVLDLPLSAG
jgi:hypothetical protein